MQVLQNEPVGFGADLWALGCLLFHMLVGKSPFKAASEYLTFQLIAASDFCIPDSVPGPARDLISKLLASNPATRPGISTTMSLWSNRSCRVPANLPGPYGVLHVHSSFW